MLYVLSIANTTPDAIALVYRRALAGHAKCTARADYERFRPYDGVGESPERAAQYWDEGADSDRALIASLVARFPALLGRDGAP